MGKVTLLMSLTIVSQALADASEPPGTLIRGTLPRPLGSKLREMRFCAGHVTLGSMDGGRRLGVALVAGLVALAVSSAGGCHAWPQPFSVAQVPAGHGAAIGRLRVIDSSGHEVALGSAVIVEVDTRAWTAVVPDAAGFIRLALPQGRYAMVGVSGPEAEAMTGDGVGFEVRAGSVTYFGYVEAVLRGPVAVPYGTLGGRRTVSLSAWPRLDRDRGAVDKFAGAWPVVDATRGGFANPPAAPPASRP